MERLNQRKRLAKRALQTLVEVTNIKEPSIIERDATIQRFEYTFEAMWKLGKQYLRDIEGVDIATPKGIIRACREAGMFTSEETIKALEMVDDRNLTSHTYNEDLAEKIFGRIPRHVEILIKWYQTIETKINEANNY
ncbi:HI0074 family nucleotidyltransferase substrate-binding subunit [Bacillus sp. FJAT-45350]|uniref:HI0074 family nucleotidyltransferase substrate-binding subunit n=1 Tax=Bacillus sp. FJAT-45350 TaxID=2011014 RepID=UPI000BB8EEA8|nr:HI0074 family nucleotidyltransferase substrate-binding subunit [Bacillus sp. FJAT-45350]